MANGNSCICIENAHKSLEFHPDLAGFQLILNIETIVVGRSQEHYVHNILHIDNKPFHKLFYAHWLNTPNSLLADGLTANETLGKWTKTEICDNLLNIPEVGQHLPLAFHHGSQQMIYVLWNFSWIN